jgi:hypothetical protein
MAEPATTAAAVDFGFLDLPTELQHLLLADLRARDLFALACASKAFRALVRSLESPGGRLWRVVTRFRTLYRCLTEYASTSLDSGDNFPRLMWQWGKNTFYIINRGSELEVRTPPGYHWYRKGGREWYEVERGWTSRRVHHEHVIAPAELVSAVQKHNDRLLKECLSFEFTPFTGWRAPQSARAGPLQMEDLLAQETLEAQTVTMELFTVTTFDKEKIKQQKQEMPRIRGEVKALAPVRSLLLEAAGSPRTLSVKAKFERLKLF